MIQHQQQRGMMRERHAYFSAMAGKYTDQDDYCANQLINIFTGEHANMEEILYIV